MKILEEYSTLIDYSIDLADLDKGAKLSQQCYTSSKWRRREGTIFVLMYDTFYNVKGYKDHVVIHYHGQLELHCIFDILEDDALAIVKIKEHANIAMRTFLEQHTKPYSHLPSFPNMGFNEGMQNLVNSELASIHHIIDSPTFEEMSEEQREIAKMSHAFRIESK